ncbi:MAG: hypothetical protein KA116_11145 [Proteobacteria bacterium]|nr:hypothetical protein [Pseudomonadota bacterium]
MLKKVLKRSLFGILLFFNFLCIQFLSAENSPTANNLEERLSSGVGAFNIFHDPSKAIGRSIHGPWDIKLEDLASSISIIDLSPMLGDTLIELAGIIPNIRKSFPNKPIYLFSPHAHLFSGNQNGIIPKNVPLPDPKSNLKISAPFDYIADRALEVPEGSTVVMISNFPLDKVFEIPEDPFKQSRTSSSKPLGRDNKTINRMLNEGLHAFERILSQRNITYLNVIPYHEGLRAFSSGWFGPKGVRVRIEGNRPSDWLYKYPNLEKVELNHPLFSFNNVGQDLHVYDKRDSDEMERKTRLHFALDWRPASPEVIGESSSGEESPNYLPKKVYDLIPVVSKLLFGKDALYGLEATDLDGGPAAAAWAEQYIKMTLGDSNQPYMILNLNTKGLRKVGRIRENYLKILEGIYQSISKSYPEMAVLITETESHYGESSRETLMDFITSKKQFHGSVKLPRVKLLESTNREFWRGLIPKARSIITVDSGFAHVALAINPKSVFTFSLENELYTGASKSWTLKNSAHIDVKESDSLEVLFKAAEVFVNERKLECQTALTASASQ